MVSWLPFYHDMGLYLGIVFPILGGISHRAHESGRRSCSGRPGGCSCWPATVTRLSAAPNFAFELAARKTSDDDMAGLDLGDVLCILNGSERVQPATLQRFTERFARFNLRGSVIRPSYGMAEATVYVATREAGQPPRNRPFRIREADRGPGEAVGKPAGGTPLVSYGVPRSPMVRIVDPETGIECPAGNDR